MHPVLIGKAGFLKVLRRKPEWGQVLNALGTVYLDQSQQDKATRCFEKAANLNPPYITACYNLARLKQREDDHKSALIMYKTILKEQPEYGEVWNNLSIAYRDSRQQDEAISCFQKAVNYTPDMVEAWNNLGVAQDKKQAPDSSTLRFA